MTHPITPPPELVQQWLEELYGGPVSVISPFDQRVLIAAAQWGADMELEACCVELSKNTLNGAFYVGKEGCPSWHHFALKVIDKLRAARRPKPPSLKEQALTALTRYTTGETILTNGSVDIIRRALEQLDD
jgi:hypothetical protein